MILTYLTLNVDVNKLMKIVSSAFALSYDICAEKLHCSPLCGGSFLFISEEASLFHMSLDQHSPVHSRRNL